MFAPRPIKGGEKYTFTCCLNFLLNHLYMMEVHLKQVKLYGYHGLVEGEDVLGGEYEVSLTASYLPTEVPVVSINQTIDYTVLYNIIIARMQKPTRLLETLATEIVGEIFAKFSVVNNVAISIFKLHPPIKNFEGSAGVTYQLKRD
jgi:dihydroneopterin aldolase